MDYIHWWTKIGLQGLLHIFVLSCKKLDIHVRNRFVYCTLMCKNALHSSNPKIKPEFS